MAFKMKGSAFKLGNVATKSALKHSMNEPRTKGSAPVNKEIQKKHNKLYGEGHSDDHVTPEESRKQMEEKTGPPMKSPLEQTKFGYHDEEGKVIADATKDIVPAQRGGGSFTKDRDESGSERATYQRKVGDVVRQTARHKASEKRGEKLKKKRLKGEKKEAAKKSKGEKRRLQLDIHGFVKPKARKRGGTKMVPSLPTVKVRKVKKGQGGVRVSKF